MKTKILFTILLSAFWGLSANSQTWQQVNGTSGYVINCFARDLNGNIYAGTNGNGVLKSTDDGANWISIYTSSGNIFSIVISGLNIFILTDDGLFLSNNNGTIWTKTTGSGNSMVINNTNGHIFTGTMDFNSAVNYYLGGISFSTDNGANWEDRSNGLTEYYFNGNSYCCTGVFSLGTNGSTLIAGQSKAATYYGADKHAYLKVSTSNGDYWSGNGSIPSGITTAIAFNGANVYVGSKDYESIPGSGIYRSTINNATGTWSAMNNGLPSSTTNVYSFAVSSNGPLYAGTDAGIFVSVYNGDWVGINNGFLGGSVLSLTMSGINDNYILAGTDGGGIWRYSTGTGIKEINESINFSISPNLVSDNLSIISAPLTGLIEVKNIFGETLLAKDITKNISLTNFDVSNLSSGVYFVTIKSNEGIAGKKFVKE